MEEAGKRLHEAWLIYFSTHVWAWRACIEVFVGSGLVEGSSCLLLLGLLYILHTQQERVARVCSSDVECYEAWPCKATSDASTGMAAGCATTEKQGTSVNWGVSKLEDAVTFNSNTVLIHKFPWMIIIVDFVQCYDKLIKAGKFYRFVFCTNTVC